MENYYQNQMNEMDKQWSLEDYLEISERQHERLSQKDEEYDEFTSWLLEQRKYDNSIMIIHKEEYDRYMKSDIEDKNDYIRMKTIEAKDFYKEFKKISGVDIFDENCFVAMTYIYENRNDLNLIVKDDNGINKRFVIGV